MQQIRMKNRKDQILTVALAMLQQRGFDSFSYQDISKTLGITKASIHHHFPRKIDLGVALCESIKRWHDREYKRANAIQGSSLEKMDYYVNTALRKVCDIDMVCPLSSLHANIAILPEEMTRIIKQLDLEEINFIAALLQEGRDSGEFNFQGSVRAQAVLCVMIYKGALEYGRVHGNTIFQDAMQQLNTLLTSATGTDA